MQSPVLVPGETCWRVDRASRVAFLIDAEQYFRVLACAMERAERSIVLLGWDFNSRVRLVRGEPLDGSEAPEHGYELAALLRHLVRTRPRLRVHVLGWDFPVLYAGEREMLPLVRFEFQAGPRVTFRLDDRHPIGASQHQKIAVIDDAVAFSGGLDLTVCRWDTPAHDPSDARRSDAGFDSYAPFHDAQMMVDGAAARALGDLARERWRVATGQSLSKVPGGRDPWPEDLVPDLHDVEVGIARTLPAYRRRREVREVEHLYARAIESAVDLIYLENQYFTSEAVQRMLCRSLERADGPEVVFVGPKDCCGWLEEQTMGQLRARILRRLRESDHHGRLTAVYPHVPGIAPDQVINVHTKLMIVDDDFVRIGSANLSNRSMGFDSECDLAVEARGREDVARGIRALRSRLLGEHLGCSQAEVEEEVRRHGSVGAAIAARSSENRCLRPIEVSEGEPSLELLGGLSFVDPERPVDFDELAEAFVPEELIRSKGRRRFLPLLGGFAFLVFLGALWRFTPLAELVSPARIAIAVDSLRGDPRGPLLMVGLSVTASLLLFPVTWLIVATAFLFEPKVAFAVSLSGTMLGAGIGYEVGRRLWRDTVRKLAGRRLNELNRELARRGAMAIAAVRFLPLAPFTLVNLVAGATHIARRDFWMGTAAAAVPGVALLTLLADRLSLFFADPGMRALLGLVGLVAIGCAVAWSTRRALVRIASRKPG